MKRKWVTFLFFLAIVIFWELMARSNKWSNILLPAPSEIFNYYLDSLSDGTLEEAFLVTLIRLFQGYIFSIVVGIPLGLLNARFQFFEDTFGVIALGFQALPSICWAPLALMWFGQTETAIFFIVVMGSIWSIALATDAGVKHVPPIYVRAARTMGSRGLHTWIHVVFPSALPFIVSGMKQGWAFSWRSLMAAEVYVTVLTGFGLGQLLHYARELHSMDAVMGIMLAIVVLGLAIDSLVFYPLERYLHHRWGTNIIQK